MKQNIYKLKNGKTQGDWQLPLTDIIVERIKDNKSLGGRKLLFVPGANSFWKEDLKGDVVPEQIWFTNGKIVVPEGDTLKNGILQAHPFFNEYYELYSKEAEAKKQLESLRAKDEVITLIKESDEARIVATSMAVFGVSASNWDPSTAELELRKFAGSNPTKLSAELNSSTYESKYLAALAFGKGIVRTGLGKNSVIWNDTTEGEIIKIARGENAILKLGEFLSKSTEDSKLTLQAIGEKIDKASIKMPKEVNDSKDAEIERLKAELVKANGASDLPQLQKDYKAKFDKEPPVNKKNNAEWIKNKLAE